MKITHSFKNKKAEKNISDDASFLLTNKKGGYCYLSSVPLSRYNGVFFNFGFKMYKVIDNIKIDGEVTELANNFSEVFRKKGLAIERFFMPFGLNSLAYTLDKESEVEIVLDVRESYSSPEFGRFYELFEEEGRVIVKYRQEGEFECFLVISGYSCFEKACQWIRQEHSADMKRNSPPFEKHVFSALRGKSHQLVFSFSFDKDSAIKENKFACENLNKLRIKQAGEIEKIFKANESNLKKIKDKEVQIAYLCALNSLNGLFAEISGEEGVFAGLPWFFQFWARDEAISLKALKKVGNVKKVLLRAVLNLSNKLNKYPDGNMISADSPGWIIKRISELDRKLLKDKPVHSAIEHLNSGLVFNYSKETWMDAIDRSGARIEINALKLAMIKASGNSGLEARFNLKIEEAFWNGSYLRDGSNDGTIRPNAFIAAYAYPEILDKKMISICFSKMLPKLSLSWGGMSTVETDSALFHDLHTGENTLSYHNGDSWFWVNNLAGIVLYRVNKKRFKNNINKIIKSSTEEILWKGAIGHHSELSSASKLSSEGCVCQAWSSAMFIELIDELDDGFL